MSLLMNWLESLNVDVKISSDCSRKKHRRSTCTLCEDACNEGAVLVTHESIDIDLERCHSCGECIMVCPLSAIEGTIESREFEKGSLVYNPSFIPSVKELLIYTQRGAASIMTRITPLNKNWNDILEQTNKTLRDLDESLIKVIETSEDKGLSRRALFSSLQKDGKQFVKNMTPAEWKMEKNQWLITKYFPDYQFYKVELVVGKCTLCQICFSFCSQKVFTINGGFLQAANEKCVNCFDCTDICPEDAIRITPELRNKSISQYRYYRNRCKACGKEFLTFQLEKDKCSICHDRNPEWLSPYE
ncbi:4Fe-4S dicluster domain-containing protein [Bacillus sp. USDA818B3_A]|uniref:4Fe-4S dicluster domain-containing protein n=1 Tax=Bacillus sp. USDA818B3_A TaxID=2698834 RepID=UPI00136BEE5A|nr:4Fe-4S dicluster domain-containing protein [Bacillus sp. USDA818B3_A]